MFPTTLITNTQMCYRIETLKLCHHSTLEKFPQTLQFRKDAPTSPETVSLGNGKGHMRVGEKH